MNDPPRTPPDALLLIRVGKNEFTRDGQAGNFALTPEAAKNIVAEFSARARDLVRFCISVIQPA